MESKKEFDPSQWVTPANNNEQPTNTPAAPVSNCVSSTGNSDGDELAKAQTVCDELLRHGANIADDEGDYFRLIEAMVDLGDGGKEMCRQLCRQSSKYEESDFEYKWKWAMNNGKRAIHIGTFYDMAKKHGVELREVWAPFSAHSAVPHGYAGHGNSSGRVGQTMWEVNNNKTVMPFSSFSSSTGSSVSADNAEMRNLRKTSTFDTEAGDEERFMYYETFSEKLSFGELPSLVSDVVATQRTPEDQDKVLLPSLVLWSGQMPNVKGLYFRTLVSPPIYAILNAPSGIANKGVVEACRQLVMPIEWEIRREQQQEQADYERQSAEYQALPVKERKGATEPKEPKYRSVFIAGNSSAAVVYDGLEANGGRACIFETEADTLASVLSQEWGQWSDLLRRAYHHERLSLSRKNDHLHIVIDHPELSVLMTCTPGQIPVLLPATQVENGLSNRFLFYCLRGASGWKSPFENVDEPLDDVMLKIGQRYLELYHALQKRVDSPLEFTLSESQKYKFNKFFSSLYTEQTGMNGTDLSAFIFRLGLSTFRIAMTLTVLRCADREPMFEPLSNVLVCLDTDFNAALTIANTLINHTSHVWANLLPHVDKLLTNGVKLSDRERQFFAELPDDFTTDIWKDVAEKNHIPVRTAERYIGNFNNKCHLISRVQNGVYKKRSGKFE